MNKKLIELHNARIFDEFIYADVYENNNYIGIFGTEICHIEFTTDLDNELFNILRNIYLAKFRCKEYNHLKLIK